jgi:hypothetical protein
LEPSNADVAFPHFFQNQWIGEGKGLEWTCFGYTAMLKYFGIQFSTLSIYRSAEIVPTNSDRQKPILTTID